MKETFKEQNKIAWANTLNQLFPNGIPETGSWANLVSMVGIHSALGSVKNVNHMFYPNGGGMDLTGSTLSPSEEGCIELHTDGATQLVKPSRLTFESFGSDLQWAYFRLDSLRLRPSGVYESEHPDEESSEEVTEIEAGVYLSRSYWDDNSYNEEPLPQSARVIVRSFHGSYVIFAKSSIYNQTSSTYDGRHNTMNAAEFKTYVSKASRQFAE